MDNKNILSILQDALEEEFPSSQVKLWSAVKASLAAGKTVQQGDKMNTTKSRRIARVALAILTVITLLALAFITPQGRAFAQRLFQFFSIAESKSFIVPNNQVLPAPATLTAVPGYILQLETVEPVIDTEQATSLPDLSCESPESASGYYCQVKAAESQAGFDAKEFLYDPKGMKFSRVIFDPAINEINMELVVSTGGGYLYLRQGMGDFPFPNDEWSKVPADAVEQITVNGQYAEFVSGTFVVYPNTNSAIWESGGQLSLHWRDGNRWFSLEKLGDPYPIEWITKDEMVKLAEGLVYDRPLDAVPPLDPEYLKSVEDAEKLAGFDVLAPTLLPVGYELKRVVWADETVRLLYGPKSSHGNTLNIFMGPIANHQAGPCSECPPGTDEIVQVGLWQGWYSRGIFETGQAVEGQPTPIPVWQADARHWQLVWNTDTLWISMFYMPSSDYGGEMNKATLIKIAESLK
jgi:hypothetical protein